MKSISTTLRQHQPLTLGDTHGKGRAAVALILRKGLNGPEVLLIQRASHPQDPWSGNLGFPGGRIDPEDETAYAAAVREVAEEVGLVLNEDNFLAQLDDHYGVRIPVCVSCFVFYIAGMPQDLVKNYEVSKAFWVPLNTLQNPQKHQLATVSWHGKSIDVPGIDLGEQLPVLWGLTYRFIRHFFAVIGTPLSDCPEKPIL
ncbi:MAG: CoA pyrophosphatase [Desulfuromonas sp.]|nr:MAG: CoA pyrophosphatase [Desulfuromonas sp.]